MWNGHGKQKYAVPASPIGIPCMKYGTVFLLAFLLLFPSVSRAVETPFGDFPEWGESIERITTKRHIIRHVREESLSLLFNVPVQTMLARETVEKQESTVLYSFLDNKLIEYVLHLEYGSADIYDATKTHLEMLYEKYTGTLFSDNKDVFVDKKGKTGILLLKNETEGIFLYFLDMEAYTARKNNPKGRWE